MAEWQEVHSLQSMLAQIQNTILAPKLSEQNCVDLVNKLSQIGVIDIIHSLDGKEYVTIEHLTKEIADETMSHGGKISCTQLKDILNADIGYIEKCALDLTKKESSVWILLQGDLIHKSYLDRWCQILNDDLQEAGMISIPELCSKHSFSRDFIIGQIQQRIGTSILGHIEPTKRDTIYTDGYIERQKSRIRGILNGITQPTKYSVLVRLTTKDDKLFQCILSQLSDEGQIKGSIKGQNDKALYTPNFYFEAQNKWIMNFVKSNGYIEYDRLSKADIPDPLNFLKKKCATLNHDQLLFKYQKDLNFDCGDSTLIMFDSCCISILSISQIEGDVEDAISNGSWVELTRLCPPVFNLEDTKYLLKIIITMIKSLPFHVFCDTIIVSQTFLESLPKYFSEYKESKANLLVESSDRLSEIYQILTGKFIETKPSQATPKTVKKRKTKGKSGASNRADEEETIQKPLYPELEFMTIQDIMETMQISLPDLPSNLISELSSFMLDNLTSLYHKAVLDAIQARMSGKITTTELTQQLTISWQYCCIFSTSLESFSGPGLQILTKYFLSTSASETVNLLLYILAKDMYNDDIEQPEKMSNSIRNKLIKLLNPEQMLLLNLVSRSLYNQSVDDFFEAMNKILGNRSIGIGIDYPVTKKRKLLIVAHANHLRAQISQEKDPALILHLAVVIFYYNLTGNIVHTPGKGIPHILDFLNEKLDKHLIELLRKCQSLIVKRMVLMKDTVESEEIIQLNIDLSELAIQIKGIALTEKKE